LEAISLLLSIVEMVGMDEAADCEEVCMGNNFLVVIICFLKLVASSCSAHWHEEQYHKASLCSSHGRRQRNFGVPKKLVPVLNLYITKLPRRMREEHPEAQTRLTRFRQHTVMWRTYSFRIVIKLLSKKDRTASFLTMTVVVHGLTTYTQPRRTSKSSWRSGNMIKGHQVIDKHVVQTLVGHHCLPAMH
jgi:hypothetical protein